MTYNFNLRVNVDDSGLFGFEDEKQVIKFIQESLKQYACINSISIRTQKNKQNKKGKSRGTYNMV